MTKTHKRAVASKSNARIRQGLLRDVCVMSQTHPRIRPNLRPMVLQS